MLKRKRCVFEEKQEKKQRSVYETNNESILVIKCFRKLEHTDDILEKIERNLSNVNW